MSDEELAVDQNEASDQEPVEEQEEELSEEDQAMAELKEAITVEREEIGALRMKLTVTVPRDTVDQRMGKEFAELKREADVPGFRKGHAPLELIQKRFRTDVGDQLKNQLIGSGYLAAVDKEEVKPLGDPFFWVKVTEERVDDEGKPYTAEVEKLLPLGEALDIMTLPKEGSLTFSCEVELKPEFELPELAKIPVKRLVVAIDDDDVEGELERMRMSRGAYQPVDKGGVKSDDLLYVELKVSVDGTVVHTESNFDIAARDTQVHGVQLEGLGDAATGKTAGEQFEVEATVPDDHENIDIRGKIARFDFSITEIKRLDVPPIDAEFLSTMGFESEDELRDAVKSVLESRLEETINRATHEQIGEYLIDNTKLEIPEGLSQRQTERSIARRTMAMYQMGVARAEVEKSMDEMRSRAHDQVVRDLKLFFILERIAEEREIDVSEERVNSAIAQIAQRANKRFDRVRDELSKGDGLTSLYLQLRDEQVLEALSQEAEIIEEESPKTKKAPKKKAPKKKAAKKARKGTA